MDAQPKPFWNTTLATVTALGTLIGAVGGLIATVYAMGATDSGGVASSSTPPPAATFAAAPAATSTATARVTPRPSATPVMFEVSADADSWWASPGTSSDGEDNEVPGETEYLALDWNCSEDSRGNGSKNDCGSGLIAVYFDLDSLPGNATIDEAVLTLYTDEDAGAKVYARRAASGWSEGESEEPQCDSSNEETAGAEDGEWRWDITSLLQNQIAGEQENFGFCLILKEDSGVTFFSREGPASRAPALTVTYR